MKICIPAKIVNPAIILIPTYIWMILWTFSYRSVVCPGKSRSFLYYTRKIPNDLDQVRQRRLTNKRRLLVQLLFWFQLILWMFLVDIFVLELVLHLSREIKKFSLQHKGSLWCLGLCQRSLLSMRRWLIQLLFWFQLILWMLLVDIFIFKLDLHLSRKSRNSQCNTREIFDVLD